MSLTLPQDVSGFVRRECPDCRRTFKTRPSPEDGLALHERLAENGSRSDLPPTRVSPRRSCPYCGATAPENAWLTLEHRSYVEELAEALSSEVNHRQLSIIAETMVSSAGPTFVAMAPLPEPEPLRREPDDLQTLYLVCCDEEVKVHPGWRKRVFCFRCGAEHDRGVPAPRVLEMPLTME
jgi:hypothetical protein